MQKNIKRNNSLPIRKIYFEVQIISQSQRKHILRKCGMQTLKFENLKLERKRQTTWFFVILRTYYYYAIKFYIVMYILRLKMIICFKIFVFSYSCVFSILRTRILSLLSKVHWSHNKYYCAMCKVEHYLFYMSEPEEY